MNDRLRAVCDLMVVEAREGAGMHEYDGRVQDLSPEGVRAGLARLGGEPEPDPNDDAHLGAFEELMRVSLGELEEHRSNPLFHIANLDLSVYERAYAPAEHRVDARRRHLAAWPDAVDAALAALDRVPAPVARALLAAAKGLAADVDADAGPVEADALAAHSRLVAHLERAATDGHPDAALGASALALLMGSGEALAVDLGQLATQADGERVRLLDMLGEACGRIRPGEPVAAVVDALAHDHPDADGVIAEARGQVEEAIAFTRERNLVPDLDGECLVGPAPPAKRWAFAMMAWAGPFEADAPSWYWVTPPAPEWPREQQEEWLEAFNRTTLPAITVHEVAPGHFAHSRALRRAPTEIRRALMSMSFAEGWAHYVEELCVEEGFRAGDPRFAAGVAIEALVRVTRLAVAIGIHSGSMTMDEATTRFQEDAFLKGPAARSEAARSTFDPTYGRYTWGKFEILAMRERARQRWGTAFSHSRFHAALLELGCPPLGLMESALAG